MRAVRHADGMLGGIRVPQCQAPSTTSVTPAPALLTLCAWSDGLPKGLAPRCLKVYAFIFVCTQWNSVFDVRYDHSVNELVGPVWR